LVLALAISRPSVAQNNVAANASEGRDTHALDELLAHPVTIDVTRAALKRVIDLLSASAKVPVQYDEHVVDAYTAPITLRLKNVPLRVAFERALAGTTLTIVPDGSARLALVELKNERNARVVNGGVAGTIVSATSKTPLHGVTVWLDDSTHTVRTDEVGHYRFADVEPGTHRVTARMLGYGRQTLIVTVEDGGTAMANFALSASVNTLDQVVVTATGEQRYRELGHIVTKLNVDSLVKNAPITSVEDLLTARVPGLQVTTSNGGMAGGEFTLRLRGQTTTSLDPQPIVIVDGVRYRSNNTVVDPALANGNAWVVEDQRPFQAEPRSPLNDLNVNDIETVEVVKGPSASTLYGPDAANGVIIITTKRGVSGKTQWHLYAHPRLNDIQSSQTVMPARGYWAWGHDPSTGQTVNFSCTLVYQYKYNICIQDSITLAPAAETLPDLAVTAHNRPQWQYGADVSGGSEVLRYFLSAGYDRQVGSLHIPPMAASVLKQTLGVSTVNDELRNPNTQQSLNLHSSLSTTFPAQSTVTVTTTYAQTNQRSMDAGVFSRVASHGLLKPGCSQTDPQNLCIDPDYQLAESFIRSSEAQIQRLTGAVSGTSRPFAWLDLNGNVGLDLDGSIDRGVEPVNNDLGSNGQLGDYRRNSTNRTARLNATVSAPLGFLSSKTTFGTQYNYSHLDGINTNAFNLAPGSTSISTASTIYSHQLWSETASLGFYGQEVLGYKDRLYLTGGVRLDGSTSFGDAYNPRPAPKVGLSWIASDEPLFPRVPGLDQLRFRVSYGAASKYPTSAMKLGTIGSTQFPLTTLGYTANAYYRNGLANPILRPERSSELEWGADLSLVDDRVTTGLAWHKDRTNDELQQFFYGISLPQQWVNAGDVDRHGFEWTTDVQFVETRSVSASMTFTYSYETSKLLNLGRQTYGSNSGAIGYEIGYPLGASFDTPIKTVLDTVGGGRDGIVFPEEIVYDTLQYVGLFFPPRTYTLTPRVAFFNSRLRVSALFDRQTGAVVNQGGLRDGATLALLKKGAPLLEQAKYLTYSGFYESSDATRWRELTISTDLPQRLLHFALLSSGSISFAVRNLALWTHYSGADPQATPGGAGAVGYQSNIHGNGIPLARSWAISFNLNP